ncbi:hypothetical protein DLAC_08701 [Tieghemostelium lacteum]|uniref:Palmitoyltransferase n=1 Tax=Tieghemostelium lacteum TaxID=361077 RepID=A0A151Z846_TIELA|nr:hypothetical protein DLAC_08701 [Tieghemostelium lacteum]|eukprot:KYQ90117.1 hypothetical protein DLAC_08701 [Tieghemostelium lacteum]
MQDLLYYGIFAYITFAVVILYTLMMGTSDFHRNGYVGALHYQLTIGIQESCVSCCGKICPGRVRKGFGRISNYFLYKPNHILQLVYLSLVMFGFYFFQRDTFAYIPGVYLSGIHRIGAYVAVGITLVSFVVSCNVNPGYINKLNHKYYMSLYDYDRYLYIKKKCETCSFNKPARSKHCRVCDKCVSRFDHHCPWINNCVGEGNLKYFLTFVFLTASLCLYGAYLCIYVIFSIIKVKNLLRLGYNTKQGWQPLSTFEIFRYLFYESQMVFPLGLFCLIISIFLYYFFGYHLWLIYKNTTTNETSKWSDIKDQIAVVRLKEKLKKQKQDKQLNEKSVNNSNTKDKSKKHKQQSHINNNNNTKEGDETKSHLPLPKSSKELHNIYDRGLWKNLYELLFSKPYPKEKQI